VLNLVSCSISLRLNSYSPDFHWRTSYNVSTTQILFIFEFDQHSKGSYPETLLLSFLNFHYVFPAPFATGLPLPTGP
jgi:hypothetical protein